MTNKSGAVVIALLILLTEVNAQNRSKIGQRLQSFVEEGRIPGAVTLVIRRGQVLNFEAVGYQDLENKTRGSFGHNGAFGGIFWVDPEEGLIRIYLEHVFGSGNESDIFMAMAATL